MALVLYNVVDMCRPVWVAIHELQELACRAVERYLFVVSCDQGKNDSGKIYGIWGRSKAVKGIFAIGIGVKFPSQVVLHLVWVLLFIEACLLLAQIFSSIEGEQVPFVLACHTSTDAF